MKVSEEKNECLCGTVTLFIMIKKKFSRAKFVRENKIKSTTCCLIYSLVDDEEENSRLPERILRNKYTVFSRKSTGSILTILAAVAVQLVVSDVMMPGIDGF